MAVPKRKVSKARRDKRRSSHWKLSTPNLVACPKCGAAVTDRVKGFMCENRTCDFALWKNSGILKNAETPLTASEVKTLVEQGSVRKNGLISSKSHIRYSATLHLQYSESGKPVLKPTFDKERKSIQ